MSGERLARWAGWAAAVNAVTLLTAALLGVPVREAAGQFVLWCGIG